MVDKKKPIAGIKAVIQGELFLFKFKNVAIIK